MSTLIKLTQWGGFAEPTRDLATGKIIQIHDICESYDMYDNPARERFAARVLKSEHPALVIKLRLEFPDYSDIELMEVIRERNENEMRSPFW